MKKISLWLSAALLFTACQKEVVKNETAGEPSAAKKTSTLSTPAIFVVDQSQVSITIQFKGGATGAPAGFSLQWMPKVAYVLGPDNTAGTADDNTWYDSADPRLCKASFSGNANLSRYNLGPWESVTVKVGEFLFDNGASTNCGDNLTCGVAYVFRAFAHATSNLFRSEFTQNLVASTLSCGSTGGGCTLTQGYWKTHGPVPSGNNANEWNVTALQLGSVTYTDGELLSIFNTPSGGNGLIALAHQLIAAKLNVAHGADAAAVAQAIQDADALIGGSVVPPIGSGAIAPSTTSALTEVLANFNEGKTGPGHCGN